MGQTIGGTRIFKWIRRKIIRWAFKYIDSVETKQIYRKGVPNSDDPYAWASSKGVKFIIVLLDKEKMVLGRYSLFQED